MLYETYLWHGRTAASWSLLARPALGAAQWQSMELLAQGQGKWLGDAGWSLNYHWCDLTVHPSCFLWGRIWFDLQQPQKARDCSKKKALKWQFPASVILSTVRMVAGMSWRFRGETELPGQAIHPNAAHCPWQVGLHLQSEAAVRRDQPLTASPCQGQVYRTLLLLGLPGPLSARYSSPVNASSSPLSHWD